MADTEGELDALVSKVLASAKYRAILPDLVRSIARRELLAAKSAKEADRAVRKKLHQVAASCLEGQMRYDDWLAEILAARGGEEAGAVELTSGTSPGAAGGDALRQVCRAVMAHHASTRERLPILDGFYTRALQGIDPPRSVLDLACGLNPLAIPWMPLAPGARYVACDVYRDLTDFLAGAMPLLGVSGKAEWRDVVYDPPDEEFDLALLLKALPGLEHIDSEAGRRLMERLSARHLLVSYPVASLGGRDKGMVAHYDAHMRALLAGRGWQVERVLFRTELVYRITRS